MGGMWLEGRQVKKGVLEDRLSQKTSVATVYVVAMFMSIMDATIVNVALPQLGREFGVPTAHVGTVVVAYLVSLAVFMPASAWLGDRFGTKRVMLAAIVVFTAASALCGAAQSLGELVAFRVVQGVGGGMLAPVGLAMLFRVFPPAERVRAARILILPIALAPALGPVLGGLLVTYLSWRWAFYVNVPLGIAGLLFGLAFLREQPRHKPGGFDVPGFLLSGAGLGALMYALSQGAAQGWTSPRIIVAGAAGAVMLAVLVRVELATLKPMIDFRLLHNRLFRTTSGAFIVDTVAFLGSLFLVALFYQDGFGVSALQSGLSIFPEALGVMVGAQIAGRLYPRFGPRRLMAAGMTGVAISLALIAAVPFSASLWQMRVYMVLLGVSQGHAFVPAQTAAFATISPAATGRAATMFNAGRQLGGALGVAVLGTVISSVGAVHQADGAALPGAAAYHAAFLVAAGIALAGALWARAINDADATPTMRQDGAHAPVG
ncbi:MAG: MDR family MFS transporter [Micromonosporaceae bacterium]